MRALIDSNPEYRAVTVFRVDWNQYSRDRIVSLLKIPRRSTLVMFNKGEEVGRVVAQTNRDAIEALFKAVL